MIRPAPTGAFIAIVLVSAFGLSCRPNHNLPNFAEYLKAEQGLHLVVQDPGALQDSLVALSRRMSLDRDRTIAWLDGDPGRWNKLILLLHEEP